MDAETARLTRDLARCDESAWQDFHVRYYDFLLSRVMARGVAESEASEVVQRIYLRVLKNPKTFQCQQDFEAWLSCLARSEIIDTTRTVRRRSWLREKFEQFTLLRQEEAAAAIESPEHGRLGEALGALEGSERALLTRHYLGGWSQEELAREHGISVKAVESRLARLRSRLRSILEASPEAVS